MQSTKAIFARRIYGPFCPAVMGNPATYYQDAENKAEHVARHYAAFRKRGYTATEAHKRALALPAAYQRGFADGYGTSASLGAIWRSGSTSLQWAERPAALGLRFVGYADDIARLGHRGWFNRDDSEGSTLRAGVWRLPHGRLVPGYVEMEGGESMNGESAALALGEIIREQGGSESDDRDAERDCARLADSIAEHVAEAEREHDSAYQAGARAAREIADAETARAEALPLLGAIRAHKRSGVGPVMEKALRESLAARLERIGEARDKRAELWAECPSYLESAWRDGYADESGAAGWNRAARALRLPVNRLITEAA